jgi:hypothetical protein
LHMVFSYISSVLVRGLLGIQHVWVCRCYFRGVYVTQREPKEAIDELTNR